MHTTFNQFAHIVILSVSELGIELRVRYVFYLLSSSFSHM